MYFLTMLITLLLVVAATANERRLDCIDSKRTLKCVVPFNCREEMKVPTKGCPKGRVCCLKFKTNVYLPLRRVPPPVKPQLSTQLPTQPHWAELVPDLSVRGVPNLNIREVPDLSVRGVPNLNIGGAPNLNIREMPDLNVIGVPNLNIGGGPDLNVIGVPNLNIGGGPDLNVIGVPNLNIRGVPNLQARALSEIVEGVEFKSDHFNKINSIENADSIAFPQEGEKYNIYEPNKSQHNKTSTSGNKNIVHEIYKNLEPGEKSVKYCKEYTKLSIEYTRAMPLLPEVIPLTIEMETCPPRFTPLIVGGKNATIEEFPHMAALGFYRNDDIDFLCGGSLISDEFILTAAHCANTRWGPPVLVNIGSSELYDSNSLEQPIAEIIPHPDYEPPSCYNDIALIRLETKLKLSSTLRPACLPTPDTKAQFAGNVAIATGWGKTGFGRESSLNLLRVSLKILDNLKCGEYYLSDTKTARLRDGITSNMICARGHEDSSHDTCQGDSGGPLQAFLPGSDCTLQVVGVTSFGKSCGMGIPGVYTRIAPYVPWIESIVWP